MIHLICALKCEAQVFIEQYKLVPCKQSSLFDTFVDHAGKYTLTISGIGKTRASAAVIHAYMLFSEFQNHAWLNIGIAGHANHKHGTPVLAIKVIDQATGNIWFPQTVFKPACATETLITVDKPSSEYQSTEMYDMEASGFFESAVKVSSLELCHSLKIISDNNLHDLKHVNKTAVIKLMELNLDTISNITDKIFNLTAIQEQAHYDENLYLSLIARHHFTHSQKLQLIKLLKRWQLLQDGETENISAYRKFTSSTEILNFFGKSLNEMTYRL
jgi:hypothetical protein